MMIFVFTICYLYGSQYPINRVTGTANVLMTTNPQFLSIWGSLFLLSTLVLTFLKRESKPTQFAIEQPPGLLATYK